MNFKPYPEYKASGIDWLGEIPSHWKTLLFKYYFNTSTGASFTKSELVEEGCSVISYGQIHAKENIGVKIAESLKRFVPTQLLVERNANTVIPGSFIFADTSEDLEGCGNFLYNESDNDLYAGYHTIVAVPQVNHNNKYLAYLFLTNKWRSQIRSKVAGVKVFSITQTILNSVNLILPPFNEQEAIAGYLDEVTGKIDALISEKTAQVEELRAYRSSLITETVTRGLNPDAPLCDSGIDWLGQIPQPWEILPFKYHFNTSTGITFTKSDLTEEGLRVISYGQIHSKQNKGTSISEDLIRFIPETLIDCKNIAPVQKGSFIFADTSEDIPGCGNFVFNDSGLEIYAGYHTIIASPILTVQTKYLAYLFLTDVWRSQLWNQVNGIKVFSVTQKILNSTYIILPPLSEQKEIAYFLDEKTAKIDRLINELTKQLDELAEYKQAVITEAVTGKVDVRDHITNN